MSEKNAKENRKDKEETPPIAVENRITIAANSFFLTFAGELYMENTREEFIDPETDKKGLRVVTKPVRLGTILAGAVAEGSGVKDENEKRFTCPMLGGKLFNHAKKEGKAGRFLVTPDQFVLIKTIIKNLKMTNAKGETTELPWMQTSLMTAIDPSYGEKENPEAHEYFKEKYSHLGEKTTEWEADNPKDSSGTPLN